MSRRLGRGLAELIETTPDSASTYVMLRTEQIRPGRFQPRTQISPESLEELKASIKKSGVIEPIIVRPVAHGTYELVAGERRLRASQQLGIQEVPSIIKTLTDREALEFSLVENIQRENLNPLEEAKGYARLLNEFGHTQEEVADAVGKNRATVANMLRLLTLPAEIQQGLGDGGITMGHAKALLSIEDKTRQLALFHQASREQLSVRQIEVLASTWAPAKRRRARKIDPQLKPIEDELRRTLGTKVSVTSRKKGGRIIIDYFSQEELNRLLEALGVSA